MKKILKSDNWYLKCGIFITGFILIVILIGQFWTPYDSGYMDGAARLEGPSFAHIFGTDNFGRDILSRVIEGTGTTFLVSFCINLIGLLAGTMIMARQRTEPITEIAGAKVKARRDYQDGTETDLATGKVTPIDLSGSNVLRYDLDDGTHLIVRPSGTEPKIKVYILAQGKDHPDCQEKMDRYAAWAETLKTRK